MKLRLDVRKATKVNSILENTILMLTRVDAVHDALDAGLETSSDSSFLEVGFGFGFFLDFY